MSSKDTPKSFTEPGALSSPVSVDLPLPRRALRDRFDLLASRARCRRDPRDRWGGAQGRVHRVFAKCGGNVFGAASGDSREPAEQNAEEGVAPRRLQVGTRVRQEGRDARLAPRRVVAVDEVAERVESGVLRERE